MDNFRRVLNANSIDISLSETSRTVSAAAHTLSITVLCDGEAFLDDNISVTHSGAITSATYSNTTGKITYKCSSNTDTSSTKTGYIFVIYGPQLLTFTLTLNKDAVSKSDDETKYTYNNDISVSFTNLKINDLYHTEFGSSFSLTEKYRTIKTYISGKTSTGSWSSGTTVNFSYGTDGNGAGTVCYVLLEKNGTWYASKYSDRYYSRVANSTISGPTFSTGTVTTTGTKRDSSAVYDGTITFPVNFKSDSTYNLSLKVGTIKISYSGNTGKFATCTFTKA